MRDELYLDKDGRIVQVVHVLSTDKEVAVTPQGGGPVRMTLRDEFLTQYKKAKFLPYKRTRIQADWLPDDIEFVAYTNMRKWNGWAIPYFTFEMAQALLPHMDDLSYDAARDAFVANSAEEEEVFESVTLHIEGAPVKAYPIGASCWCWVALD